MFGSSGKGAFFPDVNRSGEHCDGRRTEARVSCAKGARTESEGSDRIFKLCHINREQR